VNCPHSRLQANLRVIGLIYFRGGGTMWVPNSARLDPTPAGALAHWRGPCEQRARNIQRKGMVGPRTPLRKIGVINSRRNI
jgi:hypothetical protein